MDYHHNQHRASYGGTSDRESVAIPCSYDGTLDMGFAGKPVPYHISCVVPKHGYDEQCHALALQSCRVACHMADMIRGRLDPGYLRAAVTSECLSRLLMMTCLLDRYTKQNPATCPEPCTLPVIPLWLDGMFVSPTRLEMGSQLTIGRSSYLANLRFDLIGSLWKCTFADMG